MMLGSDHSTVEAERAELIRIGVLALDITKHPCPSDTCEPFLDETDEWDYQSMRSLFWEMEGLIYNREDWLTSFDECEFGDVDAIADLWRNEAEDAVIAEAEAATDE